MSKNLYLLNEEEKRRIRSLYLNKNIVLEQDNQGFGPCITNTPGEMLDNGMIKKIPGTGYLEGYYVFYFTDGTFEVEKHPTLIGPNREKLKYYCVGNLIMFEEDTQAFVANEEYAARPEKYSSSSQDNTQDNTQDNNQQTTTTTTTVKPYVSNVEKKSFGSIIKTAVNPNEVKNLRTLGLGGSGDSLTQQDINNLYVTLYGSV